MRRRLALLAAVSLAWHAAAFAYVPSPTPAQLDEAAAKGAALAATRQGYELSDYVLYQVKDALALDPALGSVDAIQLATPLERTRHAAFVAAYTGRPIGTDEARRKANLPDGWLAVIVYAHGSDEHDRGFADRFGPAVLTLNGRQLVAVSVAHSEPDDTQYPHASGNARRYVATVTYRFDLGGVKKADAQRGTLALVDASGKRFDIPVELGRFP